jgi:hypothetical protein
MSRRVAASDALRNVTGALPAGLRERTGKRGWACALFVSSGVSAVSHAADVAVRSWRSAPRGEFIVLVLPPLYGGIFDLATAISVIDLEMC